MDDEKELQTMVCSFLESDGYWNIKTADNVSQALALAKTWAPELAVLDVMLPDGNGFDC